MRFRISIWFFWLATTICAAEPRYDIVIYGGTSAAITAAVQAKAMGQSVLIVSPDRHLGGLTTSGLGWTDSGRKEVVGGLAKSFYQAIYRHYSDESAWRQQSRASYGNRAQGHRARDDEDATMWVFEPHVAEQIIERWIDDHDIPVVRDAWLDRKQGVIKEGTRIESIGTLDGQRFHGQVFIDATYEGDLIAAAGVTTAAGREAVTDFDESLAGVQKGRDHHAHHFQVLDGPVDPYRIPGDPSSGLIPLISDQPAGDQGAADHRIQAYCFRMCLTDVNENRVPITQPDGYDASRYELLARCFEKGWRGVFNKFDPLPNRKTDTNNHGPVSFDHIGANYDYPTATYQRRREIIADHTAYQKGMLYFIATDPRVPEDIQREMRRWGYPKDEFIDNGHWPHQLYIREARRMVGTFVMTQNHLQKRIDTPESVGMGSYSIDSHNAQRYVSSDGRVQNEGDIGVGTNGPYKIAMGSLLPKQTECGNLLSPVCVSSTHIAFGSIRMEPVFMVLGQSAATIAAMACDAGSDIQSVPYEKVRARLLADGQILETPVGLMVTQSRPKGPTISPNDLPGTTVDDSAAALTGPWSGSTATAGFIGDGYRHDSARGDGKAIAVFRTNLPADGLYRVRLAYPANANRCPSLQVEIHHSGGVATHTIDQTRRPRQVVTLTSASATPPTESASRSEAKEARFEVLGTYQFHASKPAEVHLGNAGTTGHVVIDAVNWLPVETD
ncbi:MAG: FAD-dependent oxidoreductase [Planctomycetota bacterium]